MSNLLDKPPLERFRRTVRASYPKTAVKVPVIATASHDTASAVAAVPSKGKDWAYLSSGTWSLLGLEIPEPIINEDSLRYNFTNEGGVGGTYRFLKNIAGVCGWYKSVNEFGIAKGPNVDLVNSCKKPKRLLHLKPLSIRTMTAFAPFEYAASHY